MLLDDSFCAIDAIQYYNVFMCKHFRSIFLYYTVYIFCLTYLWMMYNKMSYNHVIIEGSLVFFGKIIVTNLEICCAKWRPIKATQAIFDLISILFLFTEFFRNFNSIHIYNLSYIYTIIRHKSVDVRKLQAAILTRSPREMSQTDRIVWKHILSRVRVSVRPRIFYTRKKNQTIVASMLFTSICSAAR